MTRRKCALARQNNIILINYGYLSLDILKDKNILKEKRNSSITCEQDLISALEGQLQSICQLGMNTDVV